MIDKHFAKEREKETWVETIRDWKGDVTIDTNEIQKIIRGYFEILYSNNLKNVER
jgi:hypothetical protein